MGKSGRRPIRNKSLPIFKIDRLQGHSTAVEIVVTPESYRMIVNLTFLPARLIARRRFPRSIRQISSIIAYD
jgi:hypothetical protein